jgi:hypothetical protein
LAPRDQKPVNGVKNEAYFVRKYNGYKYFKGVCHVCGEQGHKKQGCPEKKNNEGDHKQDSKRPARQPWKGNKDFGNKKKDLSNITCYNCQQKGYYAHECTNKKVDNITMSVGCAEIAPKWELCEYHDNMVKHGKCCWEVKGDEEEGDDISFNDKEETMENIAMLAMLFMQETEPHERRVGLRNVLSRKCWRTRISNGFRIQRRRN